MCVIRKADFIIVESDRTYRLTLDGERFDWPCRVISGRGLRKLGNVPDDKAIYFEREDKAERQIGDHDLVDLDGPGIEAFHSRKVRWKLNVQGVVLDVLTPTIVANALTLVEFEPRPGWHLLEDRWSGQAVSVELTTVIDLRTPAASKSSG